MREQQNVQQWKEEHCYVFLNTPWVKVMNQYLILFTKNTYKQQTVEKNLLKTHSHALLIRIRCTLVVFTMIWKQIDVLLKLCRLILKQ
jgi:hypothetical protein